MCQAQIDRLSDRLEKKEKEICRLSQCLECTQAHHEKQLMDIKAQYDTLADNAVKLQKAARIWRDKYFSRT